jgi:hypothetical protein
MTTLEFLQIRGARCANGEKQNRQQVAKRGCQAASCHGASKRFSRKQECGSRASGRGASVPRTDGTETQVSRVQAWHEECKSLPECQDCQCRPDTSFATVGGPVRCALGGGLETSLGIFV